MVTASSCERFLICARVDILSLASKLDKGSSIKKTLGSRTIALASATRCRWPPVLSALAAITTRVELGTIVLGTGFRNPALLAKMADTLEEVSDGRLILGIGAGYHRYEYRAFGYPYDNKISRFEEAVQIMKGMWTEEKTSFDGKHFQVKEALCEPKPPRRRWRTRASCRGARGYTRGCATRWES